MPSAADFPKIPTQLQHDLASRYHLERTLGAGGMATVFLARDLKHDRPVALKVLSPGVAREIGTDRFAREIRLAARLQHPHICSVYDSGESGGLLWFTMPYVEGESLDRRLDRVGPLPVGEALRIAREAAQALAYAHQQGVIHRDMKPANLLIARDGSTLVADFGIARSVAPSRTGVEQTLTEAGFALGTPAYMSPEQMAGGRDVDGRTDIYSLALVLYEMLVGERPFPQQGGLADFAQRMTTPVPQLALRRAEVPSGVDRLLQRALAFEPAQRHPSMAAFGEELESLRMGLGTGAPAPGPLRRVAGLLRGLFGEKGPAVAPVTPAGERPTSAAVLPFRDLSPAQDQAYFSDGLAEELTTALSRIPGLRVAGRTGAFQFRGAAVDLREAGRKLGVGAVVSGSVRRSGDRLRIGAQLVNVADGFELWSESYDRDTAEVFRVQEEIARSIAGALRVRLMGTVEAAFAPKPTSDLEAYDLFLRGRFAWHQRTAATLPEAARCFEEAVARDPSFARAWAGLADACTVLPLYTGTSPATAWPRAKAAAQRAIDLDAGLADAHTALAYGTMLFEWDWATAELEFKRAIEADPGYAIAHHWYADFLAGRGRFEESLASMMRARELDPLSRITGVELAWVYSLLRRAEDAERTARQVLRLDPTYAHAHFVLGQILLMRGDPDAAIRSIERSLELGGFNAHATGILIAALVQAGQRERARTELARLEARAGTEYVPPFAFVIAHAAFGDLDQAFLFLERGITERDVLLPECFFESPLDPLVSDPRYARVAARIRG